jgi:hypothetical protein
MNTPSIRLHTVCNLLAVTAMLGLASCANQKDTPPTSLVPASVSVQSPPVVTVPGDTTATPSLLSRIVSSPKTPAVLMTVSNATAAAANAASTPQATTKSVLSQVGKSILADVAKNAKSKTTLVLTAVAQKALEDELAGKSAKEIAIDAGLSAVQAVLFTPSVPVSIPASSVPVTPPVPSTAPNPIP